MTKYVIYYDKIYWHIMSYFIIIKIIINNKGEVYMDKKGNIYFKFPILLNVSCYSGVTLVVLVITLVVLLVLAGVSITAIMGG